MGDFPSFIKLHNLEIVHIKEFLKPKHYKSIYNEIQFSSLTEEQLYFIGSFPTETHLNTIYEVNEHPNIDAENKLIESVAKLSHQKVFSQSKNNKNHLNPLILNNKPIIYSYEYAMIRKIMTPDELKKYQNKFNITENQNILYCSEELDNSGYKEPSLSLGLFSNNKDTNKKRKR